jgi:hypothetical protein
MGYNAKMLAEVLNAKPRKIRLYCEGNLPGAIAILCRTSPKVHAGPGAQRQSLGPLYLPRSLSCGPGAERPSLPLLISLGGGS